MASGVRIVATGLGAAALTGTSTFFLLLLNARVCLFIFRWPFALAGAVLVALFTAVRFGLFVGEMKVETWLANVSLAGTSVGGMEMAQVEDVLDRRLAQLRALLWSPPWIPESLYGAWRWLGAWVMPSFLLHDPFVRAGAKSPFVGEVVAPVIKAQFRTARIFSALVMAAAVAGMLVARFFVASKIRMC
jgi:hypothetical protein